MASILETNLLSSYFFNFFIYFFDKRYSESTQDLEITIFVINYFKVEKKNFDYLKKKFLFKKFLQQVISNE